MIESIRWGLAPTVQRSAWQRLGRGLLLALAAWAAALAPSARADAAQGLPSVEQVMSAAAAGDGLTTVARQRAALLQAAGIVETLSDGRVYRNQLTVQEKALLSGYRSKAVEIERKTLAGFDPEETKRLQLNSPRAKWFNASTRLELDKNFRAEVVEPLLAPALREQLRQLPVVQEQRQRQMGASQQQAQTRQRQALEVAQRAEAEQRSSPYMRIAGMIGLAMLAVVSLGVLTQPPGFGGHSDKPDAYRGGRRVVEFRSARGRVSGLAERSDTYVSGGSHSAGPDRPVSVSISSTVRVTQKFFLQQEDSSELLPVTLSDADIPLANGHRLGLIWASRPTGKDEVLVLVVNHEAQRWWQLRRGETYVNHFGLVRKWGWCSLGVLALSFIAPWNGSVVAALPVLLLAWVTDWVTVYAASKPLDRHLRGLAQRELVGVESERPDGDPAPPDRSTAPA